MDFFESLKQYSKLFITGTDTGVGKSVITAFLGLYYLKTGKSIAISKPIQTGRPTDTDNLIKLTGNKISVFNSYSLDLPAAPLVASRIENKSISSEKIISDINKLEKNFDCVIIEGIGGITVPISKNGDAQYYLIADLIKELNYPTIIVARPSLGTINHSILTIEYAKKNDLNVLGFIISGYDGKSNDPVIKTAPTIIEEISNGQCLAKIPFLEEVSFNSIDSLSAHIITAYCHPEPKP